MSAQYSDSSAPLLALDTASPRISVAVGGTGRPAVTREAASGRSSPSLLRLIDEILEEAELALTEIGGLIGVRGPGSFTGLRVGLSTLLGLHRALEIPATAVPTFDVLAWQARGRAGTVLPVIDALRGEWFSQLFRTAGDRGRPEAAEEPVLRVPDELHVSGALVVGFGMSALASTFQETGGRHESASLPPRLVEAEPLAGSLLELAKAADLDWDPILMTEPLYLRAPATTPPKRRPATGG